MLDDSEPSCVILCMEDCGPMYYIFTLGVVIISQGCVYVHGYWLISVQNGSQEIVTYILWYDNYLLTT